MRSPPSPETAKLEKDPLKPVPVSVPVKDPAVAASIAKVQALEKKIRDDLVAAEKKVEKKVESSKATAGKKADELEKKAKDVKKKVTKEFEKDEAIVRSFIRTHPVLIKGVLAFGE